MAIRRTAVRDMYQALGPRGFVAKFHQLLGLSDANGSRHYDPTRGRNVLEGLNEPSRLRPEEVSIRDLAEGLMGEDFERGLRTPPHQLVDVLEAGSEIVPSAFANTSVWHSSVAGLLEAKMLEGYQRPEYIMEGLVENIPSNKRTEKFIGLTGVGDEAVERKPGNPHKRVQLGEHYVTTPETVNRGIGVEVTREAVMFDLTRDLLTQAEGAGDTLALRKEYLLVDLVIGVTNTYTYNGTTYNTYVASGGLWANLHQNPLSTYQDLDDALQLFVGMTDPTTGEPINVTAKDLLVMPANWTNARSIIDPPEIQKRTATTQADVRTAPNPVAGMFNLIAGPTYPFAYRRATAADGLNLSTANAQGRWWLGDFRRAFGWVQNLPFTVVRANPTDYHMADHGLVFALFADEMGVPVVKEPRYVICNQVEAVG